MLVDYYSTKVLSARYECFSTDMIYTIYWWTTTPRRYYPPGMSVSVRTWFIRYVGGLLLHEGIIRPVWVFRYGHDLYDMLVDYYSTKVLSARYECFSTDMIYTICWWTTTPRRYYPPGMSISVRTWFIRYVGGLLLHEGIIRPVWVFQYGHDLYDMLVDYYSTKVLSARYECFSTDMIYTICWSTNTPRRYYPPGMSVSVMTWFIRYVGGLLLHEGIIRPVWVFQYGHDLYDMLVDYYSTKVLSAQYECFGTDMIYTICWWTTTPRRYYPPGMSVSVRTWFIRYVGGLLLHEGIIRPVWVFQYGHDLYDMLVDYYSTKVLSARYECFSNDMIYTICWWTTTPRRYYPPNMSVSVRTWFIRYVGGLLLHEGIIRPVWLFQYGHDLYDMLVDYYSTKVLSARYECFSNDMIYTICWWTTTPRRYYPPGMSVSVMTWFIRYVGGLLLHEGIIRPVWQCFSTDMIYTICWSTTTPRRYYPPGMTVFQYGHDLYDMLVDYYSTKVWWQCFSTDMIYTICWSTTTPRRYYPPGMTVFQYGHDLYDMLVDYYSTKVLSARYDSVSVRTWFIRYVGGLLLHEGIIRPVWQCFSTDMIYTICWWTTTPRRYDSVSVMTWFIRYVGGLLLHEGMTVFQYGHDLYDMLVDYYSTKVWQCFSTDMIYTICWWTTTPRRYECFSTDMIYTICWWTTTPRRCDSVSVRTWFIRYVGRLLLHEGTTVFQYGHDLYDMLVDYYSTKVWVFQYGHDLYDMLVDYYSTKVWQCFSTDRIYTICWSATTPRRYYPPGMTVFQYGHDLYDMLVDYYSTKVLSARYDSVSVRTWFIRYVGGLLLHEGMTVFQYGHDLYDMLVDYYSTKVWQCFSTDMIYTICWWTTTPRRYECFSTDMIYTICWWTTTPRRYDSVSVRTWFIRYVGRLLLHEGTTVFQYGHDLYDMLVDYYSTKVWVFQYGHDLYDVDRLLLHEGMSVSVRTWFIRYVGGLLLHEGMTVFQYGHDLYDMLVDYYSTKVWVFQYGHDLYDMLVDYYSTKVWVFQYGHDLYDMLVDYYSTKVWQCFSTDMIYTICWSTTTPRRYECFSTVMIYTMLIDYYSTKVWVFQYGHDLYDMLVDYYSTKVWQCFSTDMIYTICWSTTTPRRYECFSTDMIYTICWSTTTPRRYDSVSVRTWFIWYVGRLLLHEGMTVFQYGHDLYDMLVDYYSTKVWVFQYGHDLYDMLVDYYSTKVWVFQYGHDLYDMLVDYYSTKVWQCFSTDMIYTICWSTTTPRRYECFSTDMIYTICWSTTTPRRYDSVSVRTGFIRYVGRLLHCRQRAPIENVWSTSGIF